MKNTQTLRDIQALGYAITHNEHGYFWVHQERIYQDEDNAEGDTIYETMNEAIGSYIDDNELDIIYPNH